MHMNQMYFSALKGKGDLKKYAIVQQMQMFKNEPRNKITHTELKNRKGKNKYSRTKNSQDK